MGPNVCLRSRVSALIFAGAVAVGVAGCMSTGAPNSVSTSNVTNPVPAPSPSFTGTSGFTFAATDFYVDVQEPTGSTMLLHQDGDWTKPCRVSLAQAGLGIDEYCVLEAQELDLYFNGATLAWNGPNQQCSYIRVNPYSFFQYQPGVGPTTVSAAQTINAGASGPLTITGESGGTTYAYIDSNGQITCGANYTGQTPVAGPNCCSGQYVYNLTVTSLSAGNPPSIQTTTSLVDWGGEAANCLAGPAVTTQPKDTNNYPEPTLYSMLASSAVNQQYTIAAPITNQLASNVNVANYFCPGGICPTGGAVAPNGTTAGSSIVLGGYQSSNSPAPMQYQPSVGYPGQTTAGSTTITNIAATVTVNGNDTNGSSSITVTSSTGILPGMSITGLGIPANTMVIAVLSSTSLVLSQSATSTNAGTPFSFTNLAVGMAVTGPGIPTNTSVTAVGANTVTLSQAAAFNSPAVAPFATFTFYWPGFSLSAQPWYEFDCLDSAFDYVSRLRVMVRSWTTTTEFKSAMTANGAAGNPFVCGPETLFPDQPLYDRNIFPQCTSGSVTYGFGNAFPGSNL